MTPTFLTRARRSALALLLGVTAWASGCATGPKPMVDPGYAAGAYAPVRVALLPPDVFMIVDQVGDNDPAHGAALGQAVSAETMRAAEQVLRARGYDVDLSSRWDGIYGQDGALLVGRDELGTLANGILQFANGPAGGGEGAIAVPVAVAPELAARVGAATQSDALLYLNVKGATVSSGKRTAQVLGVVFFVVIIAAIVAAAVASSKGGGGGSKPSTGTGTGGGWRGAPVSRAPSPGGTGGGWRGVPPVSGGGGGGLRGVPAPSGGGTGGGWRGAPGVGPGGAQSTGGGWRSGGAPAVTRSAGGGGGWRGGSRPPPLPPGTYVYGGGPHIGVHMALIVPLDAPVYTHDGSVGYEDPAFAGDEIYVSMTMISTADGRVLWHARHHLDLEAEQPVEIQQMVQVFLGSLPPGPGPRAPAAK